MGEGGGVVGVEARVTYEVKVQGYCETLPLLWTISVSSCPVLSSSKRHDTVHENTQMYCKKKKKERKEKRKKLLRLK